MTNKNASCGLKELIVFLLALVAGTACSLTSKVMLSMKSVGKTGEEENFSYPLFQTFGMFLGMTFGLVMHFAILAFKIKFPGYIHANENGKHVSHTGEIVDAPAPIPVSMYFLLMIPSVFDLIATALCMFGLRHVDVSVYQMLRGGAIIFVALLKEYVLHHPLRKFQWVGVLWNVVSIILVGSTAMMSSNESKSSSDGQQGALFGVVLILSGAFVQSLQYAFEEKVMSMDIPAPPMLLIGMEGFWGTILCLTVLYPLAYAIPGSDHGCVEDPYNTFVMIANSTQIQAVFVLYFFSVFFYNVLACLVTFMLNSVWHAILDNFRPISVWTTDLIIFYCITTSFGESWTVWSWLQLFGLVVLLYGTAVYNAPNAGSIKLTGGASSCFLDFSSEYAEIDEELDDLADISEGPAPSGDNKGTYLSTVSPFLSPRKSGRPSHEKKAGYGGLAQRELDNVELNAKKSFA